MNLLPALGLGALTGMRSMLGLAYLSDHADETKGKSRQNPALKLLRRPEAAPVLKFMAAGEVLMDKTPFAPDRTAPQALMGRVVLGALVGAAVSKDDWLEGGVVGALGALGATFATFYIRKALNERAHLPNVVLGLAEDALVVRAAKAITDSITP